MMKKAISRVGWRTLKGSVLAGVALAYSANSAADALWSGWSYNIDGFIRSETAVSITSKSNYWNNHGSPFNELTVERRVGNPLTGYSEPLSGTALQGIVDQLPIDVPIVDGTLGLQDEVNRGLEREDNDINYQIIRTELSGDLVFSPSLRLRARMRALYDFGRQLYVDMNPADFGDIASPSGVDNGRPNFHGYRVEGASDPVPLEYSGENYFVDFPALYLQYQTGPATIRVGNQQIAWGQALFFRTMDLPNALDVRRHFILDLGSEEYKDARAPALGIRATYSLGRNWVVDSFVQQFRPNVLSNPNTPTNLVAAGFTVHDRYTKEDYDEEVNYGLRVKGNWGKFGVQAAVARRFNPAGAFRWTKSGVNKALPNSNVLGLVFNRYCEAVLGSPIGQGCGPQLAETAFEVAPQQLASNSAKEWFFLAAESRLDGVEALNAAVDPEHFPAAQQIFAMPVDNAEDATRELDAFFVAGEGLRGHISRRYFQETTYGLGFSYVLEPGHGSFFNQTILNFETSYTPDRVYTDPSLRQEYLVDDDIEFSFVAENYHRFSTSFPATYLVFQFQHRRTSDLFGRHLSGNGSTLVSLEEGPDKVTPGQSSANYVVLAAEQPLRSRIFVISASALIDTGGGYLFQPAVTWNPGDNWRVDLFANHINADAWGERSENIFSTFDFMEDVTLRISKSF